MADAEELDELLFFDTFSHEINDELNLDLVQFPKPVFIAEVRIIPLGARVQADFPGGVRLGATNPSKFHIEFFVNDLGKPGASSFEVLGNFEYNQNDCIHLECKSDKILTDGLVLRGLYTTITLAVYGSLSKNLSAPIASPPLVEVTNEEINPIPEPVIPNEKIVKQQEGEWREDINIPQATAELKTFEHDNFQTGDYGEGCDQTQITTGSFFQAQNPDRTIDEKRLSRKKSKSSERSNSRNRGYSPSNSNDREFNSRQKREWSRSPEYRHSRRIKCERSRDNLDYNEREHKWPRTPPVHAPESPRRPRSPDQMDNFSESEETNLNYKTKSKISGQSVRTSGEEINEIIPKSLTPEEVQVTQQFDEDTLSQDEPFEPILSDEEIEDDDNEEADNEELELDENEMESAIKRFDPFKMDLMKYQIDYSSTCSRDIDLVEKIFHKYETQTKINSDEEFLHSSVDEKENFVYNSEQLLAHLNQINMTFYQKRNYILEKIFKNNEKSLNLAAKILKISLNFECACSQSQPAYKIRHIKIGARMAELLCASNDLLNFICNNDVNYNPLKDLFILFEQKFMALSIKLLILKGIYSILDSEQGVNIFLNSKINGYQKLLSIIEMNPLTRAKYAIKAILKKINLFEALEHIENFVTKQFVLTNQCHIDSFENIKYCLKEVIKAITPNALEYQQLKRFLPVSEKFEIPKDIAAEKSWLYTLQSYFKMHSLAESILLLLTNQMNIPSTVMDCVYTVIESLLSCTVGLDYLVDDCFETTQLLVNVLLGNDESNPRDTNNDKKDENDKVVINLPKPLSRAQRLGNELAFKVQTRYHINVISHSKDNTDILVEHLHALYSQTCDYSGRIYTVNELTVNGKILPLLNLIEKERKIQSQQETPGVKSKSPVLSYAVDIIDCCIRNSQNIEYLLEYGSIIVDLVKNHEVFEPSVSAVLQEMSVYLKPLELINNFAYDNISQLCEVIKRSTEYITTFPGDLIMCLKILKYFAINNETSNEGSTKELKYRYVILQFYSNDGCNTLLNILEKLNTYYEQPGLHAPALMTNQAIHTCQIILPTLQILHDMLMFSIQCRDIYYKDITAIEHLMKTYSLMHYIPEMSIAYNDAQIIKNEIIQIFLTYTQPNPEDQDSLQKSLWTKMINEIIKYIISSPSTFIPGLQAFAELLPLLLPIQTTSELNNDEINRIINERKLWSAHLHPQSNLISEMIQTICPSSFPQLIDLLIRVCLQLADLAPNMTLLISKSIIEKILDEYELSPGIGTISLVRLLKFLVQLTAYPSVKISTLTIFPGRLYELFNSILCNYDKSDAHIQCQKSIHRILENFFDSDNSMILPTSTENLELNLASVLPPKELIPGIIRSVFTNLINLDIVLEVAVLALRNLIIMTEHDITFYCLYSVLESKKEQFQKWLKNVSVSMENFTNNQLLITILLFLKSLTYIDETNTDNTLPKRTYKLNVSQFISIIGWTKENNSDHPLNNIKEKLINSDEYNEANDLVQDLSYIFQMLESYEFNEINEKYDFPEPCLPQAEGIVTQYLSRPIFNIYDSNDEQQLNIQFWLEPIRLETLTNEILTKLERIPCDLTETVKNCLPPETNLTSDCKRILHLSASPQSNRERTATAPCFRTRRVEVEPTTGRPEKKLFITPVRGRGYPRTPPSRGDLFRSRPPNTSRPPSLHVDDFLALETCGAQPTGPTGYNKLSRDLISIRGTRITRTRGNRMTSTPGYRTGSPNTWAHVAVDPNVTPPPPQHFRTATSEPVVSSHFSGESHYTQPHFGTPNIRSRGRGRVRTFIR